MPSAPTIVGSTWAATTSPRMIEQVGAGSGYNWNDARRHSKATGDATTRGGATACDEAGVIPTASNSLVPTSKANDVAFICSTRG